jgi:hypothetical protein
MPVKKATRAKKTARGKKTMGLTSALGPKATTMVVIIVMAGGIMVAARQQQTKAKEALADATRSEVALSADPASKRKGVPTVATGTAATTGSSDATATVAPDATAAAKATPVTVTGCLERNEGGFRMKETAGADAPKARSWKSGFLKKGAATLDVVDPARTLQLADHVGRRVSVTGTLLDRELRARSVRRLGSCKAN